MKEIVPRPALTFIANTIYKENYETMPMKHHWEIKNDLLHVEYKWKKKNWHSFQVSTEKIPQPIKEGSDEEFITEHYWGYTRMSEFKTSEYQVEHPRWQVYKVNNYSVDVDFALVYGNDFAFLNNETPASVFLAEGSEIVVRGAKGLSL